MATNLKINVELLKEAQEISGLKTKRETVDAALKEFLAYQRRLKFLELRGTVDFDPDYDYKAQRRRP